MTAVVRRSIIVLIIIIIAMNGFASVALSKSKSVLYPPELVERARANVSKYPWAVEYRNKVVESAEAMLAISDDELWDRMFGNTITRSWMVWSDGYCPSCKKSVPMYTWKFGYPDRPWKVICPHCGDWFPKNDFEAYYKSGLDKQGIFQQGNADKSLLFNVDHPDPNDPLHMFGVDDGEGYVEGNKRWRFIGAYLVYVQWRHLVLAPICTYANAYVLTGDKRYAHKCAVLLDRVADLYPTFDFATQGVVYAGRSNQGSGYVTIWHDANLETRQLAMAYDMIYDGIEGDGELVKFLSTKARQYQIPNPKSSIADIRRNIESGLILDPLTHSWRIESNYPQTEITKAILLMILGWPDNRDQVYTVIDPFFKNGTAVDGVTGEKGLTTYAAGAVAGMTSFLMTCASVGDDFLSEMVKRYPRIPDMYRFYVDTWCFQQYYPNIGDAQDFALRNTSYAGMSFAKGFSFTPSAFSYFWELYKLTGDPVFVQLLYQGNGNTVKGLPYDIFADDPNRFQQQVKEVISKVGPVIKEPPSVNKYKWHLAILRSGQARKGRALWIDYDSGGRHGHDDGMNIGLYAKGLDLLPDFGYKPVQYGGWQSYKATWYGISAAHNTVVVDGWSQYAADGICTLHAFGKGFNAFRASCPEMIKGKQYERTVVMVDVSPSDSYVFDVFRVIGGSSHSRFMGSHFGSLTVQGLDLHPVQDFTNGTVMRNFQGDTSPMPGWSVDWKIEDRYHYLSPDSDVHLKYTDLTQDAEAYVAEAWISLGGYQQNEEDWVPRIITHRRGNSPLATTFVGIIEPYECQSNIASVRRVNIQTRSGKSFSEANVAIEVTLTDGRKDLLIAMDSENPLEDSPSLSTHKLYFQRDWDVCSDAELVFVRRSASGAIERIILCNGSFLRANDRLIHLAEKADFWEP